MNAKYNGWQVELNEAKVELQARDQLIAELVDALDYVSGCARQGPSCSLDDVVSRCNSAITRAKEVMKG